MGMEGEDEEVAEETNNGDDDGDIYDTFQGIQVSTGAVCCLEVAAIHIKCIRFLIH